MGLFENMTETLGTIVTRRVDSSVYNWMREVSKVLDGDEGGGSFATRYVDKNGDDTLGDGSQGNPFLTIQRAITSITDASSAKIYRIIVGAGDFSSVFALQPWMFIVGGGRKVTRLSPVQANWIGTGFSAAGSQEAGIVQCNLGTAFAVDFSAVGIASPGAGIFHLYGIDLESTIAITGNNSTNQFLAQDVFQTAAAGVTHTFTNLGGSLDACFFKFDSVTFSNTAAYAVAWNNGGVGFTGALTLSCASTTNTLTVRFLSGTTGANATANIVLTGDGVRLRGLGLVKSTGLANANATLDFNTFTAGGVKLVDGGANFVQQGAATADRTITVNTPGIAGTRLTINNQTAFFLPLTFVAASSGGLSYIPPFGSMSAIFDGTTWNQQERVQSGVTTLTNGVSPAILADVTANSRIVVTWKTSNGAAGVPIVTAANRTNGTRAGGGQFVVNSVALATGAVVATDQGTYDWHVYNGGG